MAPGTFSRTYEKSSAPMIGAGMTTDAVLAEQRARLVHDHTGEVRRR